MTIITLEDKRVTLHAGKVGTGEECRCECFELRLTTSPSIIGFDPTLWNNCQSLIWDAVKTKAESAGWDVTITTTTGEDGLIYPTMKLSCSCCADCFAFADFVAAYDYETLSVGDQASGSWVDVQARGLFAEYEDENYIDIVAEDCGVTVQTFGEMIFGDGCCGAATGLRVPEKVNDEGYSGGIYGSLWLPACGPESPFCNPLP